MRATVARLLRGSGTRFGGWCRTKPVFEINGVAVARARKCVPWSRDCLKPMAWQWRAFANARHSRVTVAWYSPLVSGFPSPRSPFPQTRARVQQWGERNTKARFASDAMQEMQQPHQGQSGPRWCRCGLRNASCHAQLSQVMQAKPSGESIMSSARVWAHPPSHRSNPSPHHNPCSSMPRLNNTRGWKARIPPPSPGTPLR